MEFVPWRYVANWKCIRCGECCRLYSVVLNFHEWLQIVKSYGVGLTSSSLDKLFIRRRNDGSCSFLTGGVYGWSCSLQGTKPRACQLWPFKVSMRPLYGYANEASYGFGDGKVYVYADPLCHGLRFGTPTTEFANLTVREFVEIAAGVRTRQLKSTSNLPLSSFHGF